jgi:diaminohydroxyphosphoribosylaminopyrimidine deaminase / 5-amino-6-(5-phosphoribosylamino)uracil reductase
MVGIGTVLADNPMLTCRLPGMEKDSPVRIVLDSGLRLPTTSRLVRTARETALWVICGSKAPPEAEKTLSGAGATVLRMKGGEERADLLAALRLTAERGITRLMVEGGPILAAGLLAADLVDEAVLFQSPKLVGADGIDALEGQPLTALIQSPRLMSFRSEAIGADLCEIFVRR